MSQDLQLSAKTIGQIFDGKITTWDDAAIAAENDGAKLPSTTISPVHRSDESGTTENFTDYLEQAGEGAWSHPADKVWPIQCGEGANGTSGVISAVGQGDGSIGYADFSQAGDLSSVKIKVGSDVRRAVRRGRRQGARGLAAGHGRPASDMAVKVDRKLDRRPAAYPLILASYLVACPTYDDAKTADNVKAFLSYIVSTEGQQAGADNAGSAPLPASLQEKVAKIVDTISSKG